MPAPLLRTISADGLPSRRTRPVDRDTLTATAVMLDRIEQIGEPEVRALAEQFGDITPSQPLIHSPASLAAARDRLPRDQRELLERTGARIRAFAEAQRGCITDLSVAIPGGHAGHDLLPVDSAGCYAPGGRFPLPSTVLMTAITARAAGVPTVWVASPRPTDATLAAAAIAGADGLLAIGGVQAIAAMAIGLCGLPACDTIVGPGNRWVTAAKFLLSDRAGIDMLAGPSELLILADDTADPALVAADLLAQAEHDDDAIPMLVTTDPTLPNRVNAELESQLTTLPTHATARAALRNAYAVVTSSMPEAIRLCNAIAPEHLEVMTRDATAVAEQLRHAGAVFIGTASAEVLGDYGTGPNHVLPTGGTARFRAGLSVFTFLRARTWLRIDGANRSSALVDDAAALARIESLEGHARSAELRHQAARLA